MRVLRLLQIIEYGTRSDYAVGQMIYSKSFQRFRSEMFQEFLSCTLFCKHPLVHLECDVTATEPSFILLSFVTIIQHLFRRETSQQFINIIISAFACQKFTCRNIQEGHTTGTLSEMHRCQKVVLLVVQYIVAHRNTRCHQFRDAAFDKFLRQLRIFQLVTDSYATTCPYQFRQICIKGMMWESCHLCHITRTSVITFGECDTKYFRSCDSIVTIGFVKVSTTKQQQGVRILILEREKLLHHWGKPLFFLCHFLIDEIFTILSPSSCR